MSARVVLIGGGVRSGKSAFTVAYAKTLGPRRHFIATAAVRADDAEMCARIEAHQRERGDAFETLEVPLELAAALQTLKDSDVVVVDCLTLWLSNLLLAGATQREIGQRVEDLVQVLRAPPCPCHVLLVTNEVGMGVVPESALGRAFRDVTGRTHQALGASAHEIYFAVLGQMLRIKPGPIIHADLDH
jgi:adenosylcobinamide kinase/adenosylcobinamide-phosphate guanylyltransferase